MGFFGLFRIEIYFLLNSTFEADFLLLGLLFPLKIRKNYGNNHA